MKPAAFCSVAFPKYTYFKRKGAHAGPELSSSSVPAPQAPPPSSLAEAGAVQTLAEGCAACPSSICLQEPIWGPSCLFQLIEDCPIGWMWWAMCQNLTRALPAPGAVGPKLLEAWK